MFKNRVLRKTFGPERGKVSDLGLRRTRYHGKGEGYVTRSFSSFLRSFLLLTKYYSGDQVQMKGMGGICGTYGGQERCVQGFGEEI